MNIKCLKNYSKDKITDNMNAIINISCRTTPIFSTQINNNHWYFSGFNWLIGRDRFMNEIQHSSICPISEFRIFVRAEWWLNAASVFSTFHLTRQWNSLFEWVLSLCFEFYTKLKTQNSKHKIFKFKPKLKTQTLKYFDFFFISLVL